MQMSRIPLPCGKPAKLAVLHSLLFSLLIMCGWPTQMAAQDLDHGRGGLRVMTYNADEGTDFLEVQNVTSLQQFLLGAGQIFTNVPATNPPARMQAIARQIIAAAPDLVSLQELDQWYTGAFDPASGTCGAMTLQFDMLQELLDALAQQGARYGLVVEAPQFAFPPTPGFIPPSTFLCAQVQNNIAILARTDLNPAEFQLSNVQSAQFKNEVMVPTPVGLFPEPRAWASVDVTFHGDLFRVIGTHLESFVPQVREQQGAELRNGPANTSLPIIIAMDSNAQVFPLPQDPTYVDFITAGYNDVWNELFPLAPGFTCCQAPLVNNSVSQLYQRIDLILTLGNIAPEAITLFGADPYTMTPAGLWPSDHAGVAARLKLKSVDNP